MVDASKTSDMYRRNRQGVDFLLPGVISGKVVQILALETGLWVQVNIDTFVILTRSFYISHNQNTLWALH